MTTNPPNLDKPGTKLNIPLISGLRKEHHKKKSAVCDSLPTSGFTRYDNIRRSWVYMAISSVSLELLNADQVLILNCFTHISPSGAASYILRGRKFRS